MLTFPNDENGDVLRRMLENGDDLSASRDIEFTAVLPSESSAQKFSAHFRDLGYEVYSEHAGVAPELPWDVVVVKHMAPTHSEISEFESTLQSVASALGGRNDGWGCFEQ